MSGRQSSGGERVTCLHGASFREEVVLNTEEPCPPPVLRQESGAAGRLRLEQRGPAAGSHEFRERKSSGVTGTGRDTGPREDTARAGVCSKEESREPGATWTAGARPRERQGGSRPQEGQRRCFQGWGVGQVWGPRSRAQLWRREAGDAHETPWGTRQHPELGGPDGPADGTESHSSIGHSLVLS